VSRFLTAISTNEQQPPLGLSEHVINYFTAVIQTFVSTSLHFFLVV